jgi:glyoxylase-like metal-dependent hydrolase (beta-lactamase superfamily II)
MKEILPGIYLMPLTLSGFTPDAVNMYIIQTPEGLVSIDTGWDLPPAIASMEKQLSEIGAALSDIKKVLVTHAHIDHIGIIPRLKAAYGTQFYLPANEVDLIKIRFTEVDNFLPMTDSFLKSHGVPAEELIPPEMQLPVPANLSSTKPDVLLYSGDEIKVGDYNLRVIGVPGHTPGHIAYYEPVKKFIFSGDMLLPDIATNAAFHVQLMDNPLKMYLDSLLTLKALDIDLVLPGHEYVFSKPRRRIEELIRKETQKTELVRRAFDDGRGKTAYEVSRFLAKSSRTGLSKWHKMLGWERRFAVLQSIAHLKALQHAGELRLEQRGGINYYQPVALRPPQSKSL